MVSLFDYSDANTITMTIYFVLPVLTAVLGIIQLILQHFPEGKWHSYIRTVSIFLQAFSILAFTASRQPYATALLFLFFMGKIVFWVNFPTGRKGRRKK